MLVGGSSSRRTTGRITPSSATRRPSSPARSPPAFRRSASAFGAQFLAHLCGGRAYRADRREIGTHTVRLTEAGRSDPILAGFPPSLPVVEWHGDTFDLPPGAQLLVRGEGIRHQLFRLGHVVGVQFHPEVTDVDVARWADAAPADLAAAGTTKEKVLAECRAIEPDMQRTAARLLDNFLACLVRERT